MQPPSPAVGAALLPRSGVVLLARLLRGLLLRRLRRETPRLLPEGQMLDGPRAAQRGPVEKAQRADRLVERAPRDPLLDQGSWYVRTSSGPNCSGDTPKCRAKRATWAT